MDQPKKYRVLFVCTGNTCRTPMAEGIAKKLADDKGISNLSVSSAGTGTADGFPATDYAVEAAHHWDIDISNHRSTVLTKDIVYQADLILAMSHEHVEKILTLDRGAASKTYLLKGFPSPYNPGQERVEDPIGGSLEQYNQTFLELDEVIRKMFPRIVEMSLKKGK
jgi:protein-tyrosine phosphatase